MNLSKKKKRTITLSVSSTQCQSKYSLKKFNTMSSNTPIAKRRNFSETAAEELCSENEHQQQIINLKKLNQWDNDNLQIKRESHKDLYSSLSAFYTAKKLTKEQRKLDEIRNILLSKSKFKSLLDETNQANKIIECFQAFNQQEQGKSLNNTIQKTRNMFNHRAQKSKIYLDEAPSLIDVNALNTLKQKEANTQYYRKVIQEKNKSEMEKRNSLMKLANDINNKKEMNKKKEDELREIYQQRDSLVRDYDDDCIRAKEKLRLLQLNYENNIKQSTISTKEQSSKNVSGYLVKNNPSTNEAENLQKELTGYYKISLFEMDSYQKELAANYKKSLLDIEKKRKACSIELKYIHEEIEYMKSSYQELLKEQRQYYLDILSKGYDARNEGLVWIVRRLLEMNTTLENHQFPKFLNHNDVNYIQNYAKTFLNEAQYIIILSALRKKQDEYKMKETNKNIDRINCFFNKLENSKMRDMSNTTIENLKKSKIEMRLNIILHKYKDNFKLTVDNQFEENRFDLMMKELRRQLFQTGDYIKDNENILLTFFSKNQDQKDLFDLIHFTREKLKEIKKEKEEMRLKYLELFKEKQQLHQKNAAFSLENELRKKALFGD